MKACRGFICSATVFAVAGVAFAAPNPQLAKKKIAAVEPNMASGSSAGFPKCESTGFEAVEAICAWEAGFGICGSTFTCRNTAVDGPYAAGCTAPTVQPDNCCVANPHPVNDWFMSGTAQHCQRPSIETINPAGGSQHMRFERSTLGGNPAGCTTTDVATGGACRQSAFTPNVNPGSPGTLFNPGVTTTSMDVARDQGAGVPGMEIQWSNQSNSEGFIGQKILFHYLGYVFATDYALGQYIYMGPMEAGRYHHIETAYDVCGDSITWYYDGVLAHTGTWSGGSEIQSVEQEVWLGDNVGGAIFDFDNFSVVRDLIAEPACPSICGNDLLEGAEQCEPGENGDDTCCPGVCGAVGSPDECQCPEPTNTIFTCSAVSVGNGVNGPFISSGGFFSYTADAAFTSISTCDSDFDSQIFWALTPDCAQYADFNDDCFDEDYGGGQTPGDPNASCYGGAAPPPGYQACLCTATVPGTTYTFLIGEWAPPPAGTTLIPPFCSSTVIEITKKTSCALGGPIAGGACCNQLTGLCTDGVELAACGGQYDIYSDNKLCSMVECEALRGACCNTAPGAGGACVLTTQAECPTTAYQSWTLGADCDDVTCDEVEGSCCDGLTGVCSITIQSQCGPASTWTEGGTCSSCVARTGACCVEPSVTEAICTDGQTLAQCNAAGGVWSDSQPCSAVECVPNFIPIPTVSEWGLAVLALMLLIGGKIYFSRREAAMA